MQLGNHLGSLRFAHPSAAFLLDALMALENTLMFSLLPVCFFTFQDLYRKLPDLLEKGSASHSVLATASDSQQTLAVLLLHCFDCLLELEPGRALPYSTTPQGRTQALILSSLL